MRRVGLLVAVVVSGCGRPALTDAGGADGSGDAGSDAGDDDGGGDDESGGPGDDGGGVPETCGDGVVDPGEDCDDGNAVDGDGCNTDCGASGRVLWSYSLDGGHGQNDSAHGIGADAAGNVYAFGIVDPPDHFSFRLWLRGHDPAGNELWTQVFRPEDGGNMASAMVMGPGDTLNVVSHNFGAYVGRFDTAGTPLWEHTREGSASAVAVDADGDVYVAGSRTIPDTDPQRTVMWFCAHDSGGTQRWCRDHQLDPDNREGASGLAVRSDGIIVAAGWRRESQTVEDTLLITLGQDGALLSSLVEDHANGFEDRAQAMVLDSRQQVVVVGAVYTAAYQSDVWIRKLDSTFEEVWDVTWHQGEHMSQARGVAVDQHDNVLVTGEVTDPHGGFVEKRSPDGERLWKRDFEDHLGLGVGIDPQGAVLVAGWHRTDDEGGNIWVAKLAP